MIRIIIIILSEKLQSLLTGECSKEQLLFSPSSDYSVEDHSSQFDIQKIRIRDLQLFVLMTTTTFVIIAF